MHVGYCTVYVHACGKLHVHVYTVHACVKFHDCTVHAYHMHVVHASGKLHVKVTHIAASPPLLKGTAGGEISMGFVLVGIAEETGNGAAAFKSLHQRRRQKGIFEATQ